jgi:hypothetical protein
VNIERLASKGIRRRGLIYKKREKYWRVISIINEGKHGKEVNKGTELRGEIGKITKDRLVKSGPGFKEGIMVRQ